MTRSLSTVRLFAAALFTAVTAIGGATSAHAADPGCPFPAITDVVAVQNEGADYLAGTIEPGAGCPTYGTLTRVGGTEESPVGDGSGFVLPLGTRTGEWYLSSFTVIDLNGGPSHTETFPPIAPYVVRVVNLTRIRSTSPEQYVGYGTQVTVSGVLEGRTDATGWQPLPNRTLSVLQRLPDPSPLSVTTDNLGAYTATVRAYVTDAAGAALFAGDDTWNRSSSYSGVQVHALVSATVNDSTPAVRQPVKVTGKVRPGAMPVWLERWQHDAWIKVTDTTMADAQGNYLLRYRPNSTGTHKLRVWTDGTNPDSREGVLPYWQELTITAHW
ncbi:hypothetical protein F1D05_27985 [Kribbella qitaiheensis]|uniref:Bacterial Ig-like domain-containing protein n=1 Tax=Kribbella qitaiheensis TaxID=1544730 RepID=A0A7G6X482_9ACTN|nr:hypothetical protein [Kribbella qitaiheensis]QNE21047.1 hypothetical protein F1D05_27985 [Kribbella qitaiheensis]